MPMVCPQCNNFFEHQLDCPTCGIKLRFSPTGSNLSRNFAGSGEGWQHSASGRIIFGLLLAQGLALGVRMFADSGMISLGSPEANNTWTALYYIMVVQAVQALCLLVSCTLAGAGQQRGISIGAGVGFLNAGALLIIQLAQGQPPNEVVLFGQPILHSFVGAVGGLLGSLIWRPLPVLNLAPMGKKNPIRPSKTGDLFGGPIHWIRVLLGTAVVVAGVLSATWILNFMLYHTRGQLQITSHMQVTLITWELIGLAILFGAGIAGYNTFNGPKQGLCVGIAASFLIGGFHIARGTTTLEEAILTISIIISLSLVGSWFACRLFPPVLNLRRRRISEAP